MSIRVERVQCRDSRTALQLEVGHGHHGPPSLEACVHVPRGGTVSDKQCQQGQLGVQNEFCGIYAQPLVLTWLCSLVVVCSNYNHDDVCCQVGNTRASKCRDQRVLAFTGNTAPRGRGEAASGDFATSKCQLHPPPCGTASLLPHGVGWQTSGPVAAPGPRTALFRTRYIYVNIVACRSRQCAWQPAAAIGGLRAPTLHVMRACQNSAATADSYCTADTQNP